MFFLLNVSLIYAQNDSAAKVNDTAMSLMEEVVIITSFEQNKRADASAINIAYLNRNMVDRYNKTSLVQGINSVSGVRMEERSPGSYRISLRGSSLRSPFGVRNVKVYWNNIQVTDPGGNTYFNQFAVNNFSGLEIYKGPAGSVYGAGTGGVVLMNSFDANPKPFFSAEYITGSFGLQNALFSAGFGSKDNQNLLSYAHTQADGFRKNSQMRRDNFSWVSQLKVNDKQAITASFLYSDLYYQTPGALTLAEFKADPKAARPAAGIFPSAEKAKAAIYQKNLLAGFTNNLQISPKFENKTTLYGAFAHIENPTVRNYEIRREPHFGGRTSFHFRDTLNNNNYLQLVAGSEAQMGFFNTRVADNVDGKADSLQTDDDIRYQNISVFVQADLEIASKLFITAGISSNNINVRFRRLNEFPLKTISKTYKNEIAPMLSVMRKITNTLSLGASISKGFSPPTVQELLPSTSVISTNLEAEIGTNYEISARKSLFKRSLQLELNAYMFRLKNALVQRRDQSGADYYINAGGTNQRGIELSTFYNKYYNSNKLFSRLAVRTAYTFSHYTYQSLAKDTIDFSGKFLPSVPKHIFSMQADVNFKRGFYLNITEYFASEIYLNDANSAKADAYNLMGLRLGWKSANRKIPLNIYAGIDNLTDETYSLGNDINDPRQRYYNTAAGRNYYFGLSFKI